MRPHPAELRFAVVQQVEELMEDMQEDTQSWYSELRPHVQKAYRSKTTECVLHICLRFTEFANTWVGKTRSAEGSGEPSPGAGGSERGTSSLLWAFSPTNVTSLHGVICNIPWEQVYQMNLFTAGFPLPCAFSASELYKGGGMFMLNRMPPK